LCGIGHQTRPFSHAAAAKQLDAAGQHPGQRGKHSIDIFFFGISQDHPHLRTSCFAILDGAKPMRDPCEQTNSDKNSRQSLACRLLFWAGLRF
jgi:hypothetical protein